MNNSCIQEKLGEVIKRTLSSYGELVQTGVEEQLKEVGVIQPHIRRITMVLQGIIERNERIIADVLMDRIMGAINSSIADQEQNKSK
jgi:hypothetical protein